MTKVGINAVVAAASKRLKKIRDIPNYRDSQEYKVLNDQMKQHQWTKDDNNFLNLDTDEQIEIHQKLLYHGGSTRTKVISDMFEDQPWMQDIPSMGNVNKKGKPSRVKAKRAFGKIEDPSEIGYNDDVRYKGTQAQQAADRAYNLAEGTTGYDAVKARLAELDPFLKELLGDKYNSTNMFLEMRRFNIRTVKDKLDKIAQMNAALKAKGITDPAELYSSGHGYSRAAGGPATARNFGFPELGKDNYKTQNRQDLSKADLEEIGIDTSWSMFVDRYLTDVYGANLIQKTDAQRYLKDTDLLDILSRKIDWKTALSKRIADQNNTV